MAASTLRVPSTTLPLSLHKPLSRSKSPGDSDTGYESDSDSPSLDEPTRFTYKSSSLPFGQDVPLPRICGPTYLTAQTVIQQVSFILSDKIFTFSPDTFDLDFALRQWQTQREKNAYGSEPGVSTLDLRSGAGSMALGYIFSKDFDLTKRHVPQTIVASAGALRYLRPSLEQLSLLYSVASPLVAHIAAVEYSASSTGGFVTDYAASMAQAEELGLALVSSTSTYEAQHMALFSTLLASVMPTIHTYDGLNVGRETTRVIDVLCPKGLYNSYRNISNAVSGTLAKHSDNEGKVMWLLRAFNDELGTLYRLFEYYGHPAAESVLVVFGSVEGSLAGRLAFALGENGVKIGVINVRVYRPFVEEEFLETLPRSVKHVAVLGQVNDAADVVDKSAHSRLFADVLAAIRFATRFAKRPQVTDMKYARDEVLTPSKMLSALRMIKSTSIKQIVPSEHRHSFDVLGPAVQKYTFWDVDDSPAMHLAPVVAQLLSGDPQKTVSLRTGYDNLVQGGVVRSDIRLSKQTIEAPWSITSAQLSLIGNEKLLKDFDMLNTLQDGGVVLLKLPGSKNDDAAKLEKRLPAQFRRGLVEKGVEFYLLDPAQSPIAADDAECEAQLTELAFLRLAKIGAFYNLPKLASITGDLATLKALEGDLKDALTRVEVPASWAVVEEADKQATRLPTDISVNSFAPYDKNETEPPSYLKSWKTAAKGLVFKEATGTSQALRPDTGVKTYTIRVKEHKRLTPTTYDRNIFHIEFDLGDSGLQYNIGEALGIHPENDAGEVQQFIDWYGLDAAQVVEVPSREDARVLENRTVYQSLLSNLDVFGRPPKRFYEQLADFAADDAERRALLTLGGPEGAVEFKRRAEVDTVTYADILQEFSSARPSFHDLARLVAPLKRREYSIASSQKVTPTSLALLVVTVSWTDPRTSKDRFGLATRYLDSLAVGAAVTVSLKPSVMKLPARTTAPIIMAGLGTGLAPFRAFVQERAWQRLQGQPIGPVLLYMGSRHKAQEYLYGEEWEAYRDAGVLTLLGTAFSRDQGHKIYIQDRMRETLDDVRRAWLGDGNIAGSGAGSGNGTDKAGSGGGAGEPGAFYLCGPTWPVPNVTEVLTQALDADAKARGLKKLDARKEVERLKDEGRYVLEVY